MRENTVSLEGRRTCSVAEARAAIPCGNTHFWKMVKAGHIQVEKFGGKTLVIIASLPGFGRSEAA